MIIIFSYLQMERLELYYICTLVFQNILVSHRAVSNVTYGYIYILAYSMNP